MCEFQKPKSETQLIKTPKTDNAKSSKIETGKAGASSTAAATRKTEAGGVKTPARSEKRKVLETAGGDKESAPDDGKSIKKQKARQSHSNILSLNNHRILPLMIIIC